MAEKDSSRERLIRAFRTLLMEKAFKRITIKDITDAAGLFRATFYTYFPDKYALFEVILEEEIFLTAGTLAANGMARDGLALILRYFDKEAAFYRKAMEYEGPDSCAEALRRQFEVFFAKVKDGPWLRPDEAYRDKVSREDITAYLSEMLCFIVTYMVKTTPKTTDYKLRTELLIRFLMDGLGDILEGSAAE